MLCLYVAIMRYLWKQLLGIKILLDVSHFKLFAGHIYSHSMLVKMERIYDINSNF